MRIGIITAHVPPVMGGIEIHCLNLGRARARAGHEVVLYGSLEPDQPDEMRSDATDPSSLAIRRVPAVFVPVVRRLTRYVHLRRAVTSDHEDAPFDVLHAHQIWPMGLAAARLAQICGTELCITEHGGILDHGQNPVKRWLIRWAARRARAVVTASEELAEVTRSAGVTEDRVFSLPNAIWPDEFRETEDGGAVRRRLGIEEDAFVACTVRRLVPKTGVQYALRATPRCMEEIPGFRIVVVGDGPMRSELERLARELGVADAVRFVGNVDNSRVPAYMQAADIGLFPSLAEATSIAALEFMACGTPVVASTVGGLPEIIEDGTTGFLFDLGFTRSRYTDPGLGPEAVDRLTEAVKRAADSDLVALGDAARQAVREEFSWPAYVRALERRAYPDGDSTR